MCHTSATSAGFACQRRASLGIVSVGNLSEIGVLIVRWPTEIVLPGAGDCHILGAGAGKAFHPLLI